MKKSIFLILISTVLVFSPVFSQIRASFGFDRAYDLTRMNEYQRIIGADSDGFYALRMNEQEDLFLEFYNGSSKNQESVNQLMLPMVGGVKSQYVEMFYIGGKLVLLTQVVNNSAKEKSLYIQHVNRSGQIVDEPKIIGRLSNQNMAVDFNVKLTQNEQNVFVYYYSVFQNYNDEPFFVKIFDSNLREVYNHAIKIPKLKGEAFDVIQTGITKTGKVLFLTQISPDQRRAARMKEIVYDYKLLVFDPVTAGIESFDITANRYELQNVIFGVDEEENVDFYGFMSRRNRTNYEGIFHSKLDLKTKEFDRRGGRNAYYVFERNELPLFRSERLIQIRDQEYNYELIDVLHLSNGGSVFIAEHRNQWADSTVVPGSRDVIYYDYYKYNDILVAYTAPNNEMQWMTRIPKDQWSVNDYGKYSSFAYGVSGEKLFLFYNEAKRNIKNLQQQNLDGQVYRQLRFPERNGVATYVSVFSDGHIEGGEMFIGKNKKNFIVPELVKKYYDRYYVYSQRRVKFKFASFTAL